MRKANVIQSARFFSFVCTFLFFVSSCLLPLTYVDWKKVKQLTTGREETRKRLTAQQLCMGNVLDLRNLNYNHSVFPKTNNGCYLLHYKNEHIVKCLDLLNGEKVVRMNEEPKMAKERKWLHFAFIGDSRIRQHFVNFLKIIPDYERSYKDQILTEKTHGNVEITFDVLNLKMSFKWIPYFDAEVIHIIRFWMNSKKSSPPHWVLMGMALWDMMAEEYTDFQTYVEETSRIAPVLNELATTSRVIWLNQYPVVDVFSNKTRIFNEKIHRYNTVQRNILRNHENIQIWDSSNPLAEEYVRSCLLSKRKTLGAYVVTEHRNCMDRLHPGYAALEQATQILFNDMCNAYLLNEIKL